MTETVVDVGEPDPTGLFFDEQSERAIVAAVEAFERNAFRFNAGACVSNATRFAEERFRAEFAAFVDEALAGKWRGRRALPAWTVPSFAAAPSPVPVETH